MKKLTILFTISLSLIAGLAYGANLPPQAVSVTPYCGSIAYSNVMYPPASAVATFTTTFSDPNGWQDIRQVYMLINTTNSPVKRCPIYVRYDRDTNNLYVRDWYDLGWIGGNRPGPAADAGAQWYDTNNTTFYRLKTTVTGSGNTLTVNWSIRFKSGFGMQNIYLNAVDMAGATTGFVQKGTVVIGTNYAPQIFYLTPSTGTVLPNTATYFNVT